jgi:hypothetical protein
VPATVAFSRWRFNVSGLDRPHAEDPMIYEQRIYTCIPGRLPALLKRFEEQTLKIWDKHGIQQAGFWTVLVGDGNHDLHYLLAWDSLAERERIWNVFQADPAWHKARDESEKDGPIIANIKSSFLRPTAFSAVK